ncbi:MAG: DsbA family protein [Ilumatobacteraceae bacterium]
MSSSVIEVFADIWCPFAHVGLRLIRDQRDRSGRTDVPIVVRAWPLELVNGTSLDPAKARHHAGDLRSQVAPQLFGHVADPFPTTSLPALALAARAYRVDASTGERVSYALRDALFEQGIDIGDANELTVLAEHLGVPMPDEQDHERVLSDWHEGQACGVQGSPHVFCGTGDGAFCPSLRIERDTQAHLTITNEHDRLTMLIATHLASLID